MERLTASETATPTLPIRIAAAASVAAHVLLLALVVSAGVYPYDQAGSQAITVDLVTPDAAPPPPAAQDQQPLTLPEPQAPAAQPPQQQPQQQQQQQAAAKPEAPAPQPAAEAPAPSAAATAPPETPPWPPMGAQAPDITERYQVMLGLPSTELPPEPAETGGGEAAESAKIARSDVDKLRAHLRRCATLPGGVARSDKVRIVMRIALTPDGRLASPPALIEASASAKGPALMQAASKALQDCQPYAMLPREKYREWRVLDLSFTPADFNG